MTKQIRSKKNDVSTELIPLERGPEGIQGITGPIGADGPKGPVGDIGLDGIQGIAGEIGLQGPQGAEGPRGATGPRNPDMFLGYLKSANEFRRNQRLEGAVENIGKARSIAELDPANYVEIVEDFANLTTNGWKQSIPNQYKGNGSLRCTGATDQYIILPLTWNDNDIGSIEGLVNYYINGSGDNFFFGLQFNNQNVPQSVGPPDAFALGLDSNHTFATYTGSSAPGPFSTQRNGANFTFAGQGDAQGIQTVGPYLFHVTITETTISLYIQHAQLNYSWAACNIPRVDPATGLKRNPTGFALKFNDSRANLNLPAHNVPYVRVRKNGLGKPKANNSYPVYQRYPFSIFERSTNASDPDQWRISVPPEYDERQGAPLFVFIHGSITGHRDSLWSDVRSQHFPWFLSGINSPIAPAAGWPYLQPGAFILTLDDGSVGDGSSLGDRWGNQKSIDNYAKAIDWVKRRFNITHTFISGQSMGAVTMFNGIKQGAFGKVDGMIGNGPAYAMRRIGVDGSGAMKTSFKTAYGITSNITFPLNSEALTKTTGYRPEDHALQAFKGIPALMMAGVADRLNYNHAHAFMRRYGVYQPIEYVLAVNPDGAKSQHVDPGEQGPYIITWMQEIINRKNITY